LQIKYCMNIFFENPWWIIFVGIILEAYLGTLLFRSGRGLWLWPMLAVLILMVLGVCVERLVVTERERVEMTLSQIAAALEANDLERVLSYISPNATPLRRRATWVVRRFEIQNANFYNLKITINRLTSPHTARAAFFGHVTYRDRQKEIPYNYYSSRFIVDLYKQNDSWILSGNIEELDGT